MLSSIPAHSVIHSDIVLLNGVAFPIRSLHRDAYSISLTLVGVQSDLFVIFHNSSLINVRPRN